MAVLGNILKVILPKRRGNDKGTSLTNTYDPQNNQEVLTAPRYREHLEDLFTTRTAQNSQELIRSLFKHDPDVSAAVNAYLTVANTEPMFIVRDLEGNIDREGHKVLKQLLTAMTTRQDYSKGFLLKPSLAAICEEMRYMLLLRGGIASELVVDKTMLPKEFRQIDLGTIHWKETAPGLYTPVQEPANSDDEIDLNIPTFFVAFYRRDPTNIYTYSPFVSSINTIAARQQVINDLYRIMQKTGYPRIDVKVAEEVLRKNAPAEMQADETKMRSWLNERMAEIRNAYTNMRPEQASVHFDSVDVDILNEGGPKQAMDVSAVIEVLNAQNQAALKTMATIIGRGESGVNTASVEASVFAKNAEELNRPVADTLAQMLTLALRLQGIESYVEVRFKKVDLRPELELENHKVMRQSRLMEALSYGVITDDEFHIELYNRHRPDAVAELSGSGFYGASNQVDPSDASTNNDSMGRSLTPDGAKSGRSKQVQK